MGFLYIILLIFTILIGTIIKIYINNKNEIVDNTQKLIEDKKSFFILFYIQFIILFIFSFLSYSSSYIIFEFIYTYVKIASGELSHKSQAYNNYYDNYYKDVVYLLISIIIYSLVLIFIYKKILRPWEKELIEIFTELENFIIFCLNIVFLFNLLIMWINTLNLSLFFIKIRSFSNKYYSFTAERCRDFRKKNKTYKDDEYVQKYIDDDIIIKKKLMSIKKNNKSTYESVMENFETFFYKFKSFIDNMRLSLNTLGDLIISFKDYFFYKINFLDLNLYKKSLIQLIFKFKEYFKCLSSINNFRNNNIFNFTNNYKFFYNFFSSIVKISIQNFIKIYDFFILEFRLLQLAFVEMNFVFFFFIFSIMLYTLICIFLFFIYDNTKLIYKINYYDFKISYCKYKFKKHKRFIIPKLYCFLFFIFKYFQYIFMPYFFYCPTFISNLITLFFKTYVDPNEYLIMFLLLLLGISSHYELSQKLKNNKKYTLLLVIYILVFILCLYLSSFVWITIVLIFIYMAFFYFSLFFIIIFFFKKIINWIKKFFL